MIYKNLFFISNFCIFQSTMDIKFTTTGFRAKIAEGFTAQNVQRTTYGIVSHIFNDNYYGFKGAGYVKHCKEKKVNFKRPLVIVGHDTRGMSRQFARVAANELTANGIIVKMAKFPMPTPAAQWAVLDECAVGAIVITASEFEYDFNGLKWVSFYGGIANKEIMSDIENRIPRATSALLSASSLDYDYENSAINELNFRDEYLKHLAKVINVKAIKNSKLKVGVDPLFGASAGYLRRFLEKSGLKPQSIHSIHENRDIFFGHKTPNAGPDALKELSKLVVKNKLNIGIACNSDADRFGIIDEKGQWVSPNEILALVLEHLIKNKKLTGRVCRSVITSHLIDEVANAHRMQVRETPVGFKHINNLMLTGKYLMGAEETAGLAVSTNIPDRDGILACMLIVEMMAMEKKSFDKIRKDFYKKYPMHYSKKVSLPLTELEIETLMEKLDINPPLSISNVSVWRIDQTDGFKFILKKGSWLAVRPSGTDNIIRIYAESKDKKLPDLLIKETKKIISQILKRK
jgi:phosphomannomutase